MAELPPEPGPEMDSPHSLFKELRTPWPHSGSGVLQGPWILMGPQQLPSRTVSSAFTAAPGIPDAHIWISLSPAFPGSVEVVDVIYEERENVCKNSTGRVF